MMDKNLLKYQCDNGTQIDEKKSQINKKNEIVDDKSKYYKTFINLNILINPIS